jgi:MoaE-MoaD fusion protein
VCCTPTVVVGFLWLDAFLTRFLLLGGIITTMQLRLLLFAAHARAAGLRETTLEVPAASSARAAAQAVAERFGLELAGTMLAINDHYAAPDVVLREGDQLALIPPVSGG